MAKPSLKTIKRLYALSGNICGLPGCSLPIVDRDGIVLGEICHIRAATSGGPRFDAEQSDRDRHGFENLVLLCGVHHKVVDDREDIYTVDVLTKMKAVHGAAAGRPESDQDTIVAKGLLSGSRTIVLTNVSGNIAVDSPGAIQSQTINLKTTKKTITINAPPGTIGADQQLSRYVEHLIKRYNEFASRDKVGFHYGVISRNIETTFRAKWKLLPVEKAEELFEYLQGRIARTQLAKLLKARGQPAFSSYEEFVVKSGF